MVGRLTMSACAGQRTSGEASGRVWWSSSRTDWNHGHGCSHGDGASQPKQQGSTVQLLNIISSPVPLSACGARLERGGSCSAPRSVGREGRVGTDGSDASRAGRSVGCPDAKFASLRCARRVGRSGVTSRKRSPTATVTRSVETRITLSTSRRLTAGAGAAGKQVL